MPHLKPGEQACLHYIIRHTYGYIHQSTGERKTWDIIALSQFVNGIESGGQIIDFGTGMTRRAVVHSLDSLEEKDLVEKRWECLHCHWQEGQEHTLDDVPLPMGHGAQCPRCKRLCTNAYSMKPLTAKRVIAFLDAHAKGTHRWGFDTETRRFYQRPSEEHEPILQLNRQEKAAAEKEEIQRLGALLWYPELVKELIQQAATQRASGKITNGGKINIFLRPVIQLQEQYSQHPQIVKKALEACVHNRVCEKPNNNRWWRYAEVVAKNTYPTAPASSAGRTAGQATNDALQTYVAAAQQLLHRAANLNRAGEQDAARVLLSDVLAQTDHLLPVFQGDTQQTNHALRMAFKHGYSDFQHPPTTVDEVDFYPEYPPVEKS